MTQDMKQTITLLSIALGAISGHAQTEAPDSLSGQELQEIVIEAPKVIRKADMDVYHPSKSAVENSKNGMQLLNNLMIPSLNVSEALGSIQAAGQSVQIRINGRESTIDQVRALLPETIKRVEWIDNPGLRYGGANYVLNFIVSNPTVGGSFQGQARPALNQAWGFYMADAKFNVGRSQWEVYASCKLTEDIKIYRDYNETFTYPDGTSITRRETPRGGCLDNTLPYYFASYNYIKPDTTVCRTIHESAAFRQQDGIQRHHVVQQRRQRYPADREIWRQRQLSDIITLPSAEFPPQTDVGGRFKRIDVFRAVMV